MAGRPICFSGVLKNSFLGYSCASVHEPLVGGWGQKGIRASSARAPMTTDTVHLHVKPSSWQAGILFLVFTTTVLSENRPKANHSSQDIYHVSNVPAGPSTLMQTYPAPPCANAVY